MRYGRVRKKNYTYKRDIFCRYEAEEWKKEGQEGPQDHLSDLLKRIEQRKREKEAAAKAAENDTIERTSEQINESSSLGEEKQEKKGKKRKGRKRKLEEQAAIEATEAELEETAEAQSEGTVKAQPEESVKENGVESKKDSIEITQQQDFTVLGSKKRLKTQSAKRVLPQWLTQPEIVHPDLSSGTNLDDIEVVLDSKLIEKLKADGFNRLFPVQDRVLSWLLKCDKDYRAGRWVRDTCVCMPTGSG